MELATDDGGRVIMDEVGVIVVASVGIVVKIFGFVKDGFEVNGVGDGASVVGNDVGVMTTAGCTVKTGAEKGGRVWGGIDPQSELHCKTFAMHCPKSFPAVSHVEQHAVNTKHVVSI